MERTQMKDLLNWSNSADRKPLLLRGARQTGKTWLIDTFAQRQFQDVVKIDFMLDGRAASLFEPDLDPKRIIAQLELRHGRTIDPQKTLIFFDEIQEAPRGVTSLKYFCERARDYHVIASGSYMGISGLHPDPSFPVGKVQELTLHPLSFEEFLLATSGEPIARALSQGQMGALEGVADLLRERLKQYLATGGMPEVVSAFVETGDLRRARAVQQQIIAAYDADFGKHAPARILERMRLVWGSLPGQLARENKRFLYSAARPGGRARDFEEAIQWLADYGVTRKVNRVSALRVPLQSYEDLSIFKLFCLDVGLLGALCELNPRAVTEGSRLFTEFKGALTEQFVCQELVVHGHRPVYWSSEKGTAETDFAVGRPGEVVPIEVKAAENLRSKSLRVACDKFGLGRAVRTSLSGFRDDGWLVNVPLWAIGALDPILDQVERPDGNA